MTRLAGACRAILFGACAFAFFIAPAQAQQSRFGVIEVGGSGVKASVVAIEDASVSGEAGGLSLRTIYDYPIGNLNPAFAAQIEPVATLIGQRTRDMQQRYALNPLQIYLVGASGLQQTPHGAALAEAINRTVAGQAGQFRYISAADQARYGYNGVVNCRRLAHRRADVVFVDIGSSEIIAAAIKAPAPRCGQEEVATLGFGFGVKSARFNDQSGMSTSALHSEIQSALALADPALSNRTRIYLGGGIVWMLASFVHPNAAGAYVSLSQDDIDRMNKQLLADPRCVIDPVMAQRPDPSCAFLDIDFSQVRDPAQRARVSSDHRELTTSIYSEEQMRTGVAILAAFADTLNFRERPVFFARSALRAWVLGFLLEQESGAAVRAAQ